MFKTVNIPTANQAADLQAALEAERSGGGFEVVQVHDNIVIMDDGAALGHTAYEIVPIPSDVDTDALDAALNAATGALIAVHPNFAVFAAT